MTQFARQTDDKTGENSATMSIDSPAVVTMTDLDTIGMTSVTFTQGISVTGGGESTGPAAPTKPDEYEAICHAVFHPLDLPGALPNGVWVGSIRDKIDDAFGDCSAHEDGGAQIYYRFGAALVGPVTFPV